MSTAAVTYTVPSNGWTGSVDVTDADLLNDVTIDDYKIFYDDVEQGSAELANWAKSSATSLTYSGSSLDQDDVVTIWRNTPNSVTQLAQPVTTIQSSLWNNEFDRVIRRAEEAEVFYESNNPGSNFVQDTAYSSGWDGVTSQSPSANAVYDMLNSDGNTFAGDSTFSGDLTVGGTTLDIDSTTLDIDSTTVDIGGTTLDINSTTVDIDCTTFDVDATSCDLSGSTNVLAPTVAKADGGTFTTDVATTAWVNQYLPISTMNGRITITTGEPVLEADGNTTTDIFYTPYQGNQIWLYNTSDTRWEPYTLSEVSYDISAYGNDKVSDVFIYDNSGTLTLDVTDWTDWETRATSLVYQDGVLCKSGALDRRYIGSICTSTNNTITMTLDRTGTDDLAAEWGILNYYNRVQASYANSNATNDTFTTTLTGLGCGSLFGIFSGTMLGINHMPSLTFLPRASQLTGADLWNVYMRHLEGDSPSTTIVDVILDQPNTHAAGVFLGSSSTYEYAQLASASGFLRLQPVIQTSTYSTNTCASTLFASGWY